MKKLFLLLLSLTLLAALPAFAEEEADDTVTYMLNGDASQLTITLLGNATTGYEWTCTPSEEGILTEVSMEYIPDEADEGMTGVGGKTVFVFEKAEDGGSAVNLLFVYEQPWDPDSLAMGYGMDVEIAEDGTLAVRGLRKVFPVEWLTGDRIVCPECGNEDAVIEEVVTGGDEETGPTYFLEIMCPTCGLVEEMA